MTYKFELGDRVITPFDGEGTIVDRFKEYGQDRYEVETTVEPDHVYYWGYDLNLVIASESASAGAGDAVADAKPTYAELQAEVARLRADLQSTEDNELSFLGALQIIANWLRGGEGYRTEDGFTAQSIYDMVAKEIGLNAADATWIDNTRQQLADMRAALIRERVSA